MSAVQTASPQDIKVVERLERLPITSWQVKARVIFGVDTLFDAQAALTTSKNALIEARLDRARALAALIRANARAGD